MTEKIELGSSDPAHIEKLHSIQRQIKKSRKIVVVTGAGISCSAGIPDFRSSDGLYNLVKHQYPDVAVKGKDLFDTVLFSNERSIAVFYTFMAALRQRILDAKPTATHRFIHFLKTQKRLLRCYTQNIDNLEARAMHETAPANPMAPMIPEMPLSLGVDPKTKPDVVQLHGDIDRLRCMQCSKQYSWFAEAAELCSQGEIPACPSCYDAQQDRITAGKRCTGVGSLRPDIVLYGEEHPDGEAIAKCSNIDLRANPDCMVIMGTSLKVTGIRKLVRTMAGAVKDRGGIVVLVNATELSSSLLKNIVDYHIHGSCDDWVDSLRRNDFFRVQKKLNFTVSKQPHTGQVQTKQPSLVRKKLDPVSGPSDLSATAARKMSSAARKIPSPPSTPQKPKIPTVVGGDGSNAMPLTPQRSPSRRPLADISNELSAKRKLDLGTVSSCALTASPKRQRTVTADL